MLLPLPPPLLLLQPMVLDAAMLLSVPGADSIDTLRGVEP